MPAVASSHRVEGQVSRGFRGRRRRFRREPHAARGIAHAYAAFAGDGRELSLRRETLDLLAAPAVPAARGFFDECLKGEVRFSLGFMKPRGAWRFGGERSFGAPGSGGALGFADPDTPTGYAYVTRQMGTAFTGDPRDVALRAALSAALSSS
jgi:CubicO group peptidase (beta-lactamase class C family)